MNPTRATGKIRNLRWYIAALLFTSTVINYIDRQALSVAAPRIKADLHLSQVQYGHILQSFLLAYTIFYVVTGFLTDLWGTRRALTTFVTWWSAANILHVFARTATSFSFFRFLLGMGEPGNYNAIGKAASEWFPARERAFINGLANAGSAVGAILAVPLVAWLLLLYGWRSAFVVTGMLGFVWLIPWLLIYNKPEKHPRITSEELSYIQSGPAPACDATKLNLSNLLRRSDIWALMIARFLSDPVWWFYILWLPSYLQEQRGFSLTTLALVGWMPYLASDIGGILGGWISDRIVPHVAMPVRARMIPMGICALMMPVSFLVPHLRTQTTLLIVLCIASFAHMSWKTNLMTITNDLYPAERVGSIFGILMLGSGIGGFLFQGVVARLAQHGSFGSAFTIMGFLHPAAFLVCLGLWRKRETAKHG